MSVRKISRKEILSACAERGEDDGLDPRLQRQAPPQKVANRKALQLCGQVTRTLAGVLSGECNDDVLRDLLVESVVPAPNSSRLLVTVSSSGLGPVPDAGQVLRHLERVRGKLRGEVAAAIHRRKAPDLTFHVRTGPAR